MGYFKNINLFNYRNFSKFNLEFGNNCNVLIGKNGSGKTNILESISLLEKGRGIRKDKINNLINFNNIDEGFKIFSIFQDSNINYDISICNSDNNKKKIFINDKNDSIAIKYYESLFAVIYFLPEMERMFVESPSFRRNFLDRLIFSSEKNYNSIINSYKKALTERQILLKKNNYDEKWLEEIEKNIVNFGSLIYKKRDSHIQTINTILKKINSVKHFSKDFYLKINDQFLEENPNIYNQNNIYLSKIKNNRKFDYMSGRCSVGPHRSDLIGLNIENKFNLNQLSTGQQKTIVLLIIISQCEYLIKNLNLNPIILLDEICSHLDDINRELLLYLVNQLNVQVFMTGTDRNYFSFLSTKANYYNIA